MKQLCSTPLIQGKCVDNITEYRVFATDGDILYPLLGALKSQNEEWETASWAEDGAFFVTSATVSELSIPQGDLAQLLSGVITKEDA